MDEEFYVLLWTVLYVLIKSVIFMVITNGLVVIEYKKKGFDVMGEYGFCHTACEVNHSKKSYDYWKNR